MADVDMKDATATKEAKVKSGPSGASGKPRFEVKKVCPLGTWMGTVNLTQPSDTPY